MTAYRGDDGNLATITPAEAILRQVLAPEAVDALLSVIEERLAGVTAAPTTAATSARWLTLAQAAERLDCSKDAVRMRAKRGRLESRHHGRRLYVSAASVDALGSEA